MRVAGSRPQGPVGQVSRGLGARAPRAWGPAHQGLGKNHPNLSNYDFFANLLVGAWRRRGCRLKRLLRRWGPGGKRSRDTPPYPPPSTFRVLGCKGERKRVFTLSAFGNHPTRPPRSADRATNVRIEANLSSSYLVCYVTLSRLFKGPRLLWGGCRDFVDLIRRFLATVFLGGMCGRGGRCFRYGPNMWSTVWWNQKG